MRKLFVSSIALMAIATTSAFAAEVTTEKAPVTIQAAAPAATSPQASSGVVVPAEQLLDNPSRFAGAFTDMATGEIVLFGDAFGIKIKMTTELAKACAEKDSGKIKSLILKKEGVDPAIAKILETSIDSAVKSCPAKIVKMIADYQKIMYGEGADADKKLVTFAPADSMESWLASTDLKKDVEQLMPKSEKKSGESIVKERKAILGILKISKNGKASFILPKETISKELGFLSQLDGYEKAIKDLLKEKETKIGSAAGQIKEIKDLESKNSDLQRKIDEEKGKIIKDLEAAEKKLADANEMPDKVRNRTNTDKTSAIKNAKDKIAALKKGYDEFEKEFNSNSEKIKSLSDSDIVKDSLAVSRVIDRQIVPQLEKVQKLFENHLKKTA